MWHYRKGFEDYVESSNANKINATLTKIHSKTHHDLFTYFHCTFFWKQPRPFRDSSLGVDQAGLAFLCKELRKEMRQIIKRYFFPNGNISLRGEIIGKGW
jgi:hypothetical protein